MFFRRFGAQPFSQRVPIFHQFPNTAVAVMETQGAEGNWISLDRKTVVQQTTDDNLQLKTARDTEHCPNCQKLPRQFFKLYQTKENGNPFADNMILTLEI